MPRASRGAPVARLGRHRRARLRRSARQRTRRAQERAAANAPRRDTYARRRRAQVFDKDANGLISAQELKDIMKEHGEQLSEDEIAVLIRECDGDHDGNINYEEFLSMLMSK